MRWFLVPFSVIYGIIIIVRNKFYDWGIFKSVTFPVPVISLGNITVGGTGKTPHAEYLIRLLNPDFKVALLSRGYKRKTKGYVEVATNSTTQQVGDEPLQIKQKFPEITVAVDEKRKHGIEIMLTLKIAPEVIILDDAFQHRSVKPIWNILLIDYQRLITRDFMLPAGNLREPSFGKNRAHVVFITKCPQNISEQTQEHIKKELKLTKEQKLFFTTFQYGTAQQVFPEAKISTFDFEQSVVLALTGIANPNPFYRHLNEMGVQQIVKLQFPDHHHFSLSDLNKIKQQFLSIDDPRKCIITTEKDAVRLKSVSEKVPIHDLPVYYIPIEVVFLNRGETSFHDALYKILKKTEPNNR